LSFALQPADIADGLLLREAKQLIGRAVLLSDITQTSNIPHQLSSFVLLHLYVSRSGVTFMPGYQLPESFTAVFS
jgi:hypothetical protein